MRATPRPVTGSVTGLGDVAGEVPERAGLDRLAPSARRGAPPARVAVGAAVVLFIGAVALAAVISFASSGGGDRGVVGGAGPARVGAAGSGGSGAGSGGSAAAGGSGRAAGRSAGGSDGAGTALLLVHVLGAVARPGLVQLTSGARVVDAVAAAGGFTAAADQGGVNLARPVVDGEQLVVPAAGVAGAAAGAAGAAGAAPFGAGGGAPSKDGLVHLNTANVAELDTLPRIGPALAQRIIDWRDANGPFTSVDQLREVSGIGDAVFTGLAGKVAP